MNSVPLPACCRLPSAYWLLSLPGVHGWPPPKKRAQPVPKTPLEAFLLEYLNWMQVKNYSPYTTRNRRIHLEFFLAWARERALAEPTEITRPVLELISATCSTTARRTGRR